MSQKLHYVAPAAEIYEVLPESALLQYSGGNRGEKFSVDNEHSYNDSDFS